VYELTGRGRKLEPILDALGDWGSAEPRPANSALTATSVLLFLRGSARAHPSPPTETYRLQLDDRVWTVSSQNGQLEIKAEDTAVCAASLRTDPETFNALLLDPGGLDVAIATGAVHAEGDLAGLRRLLHVAT
jgi:hypothetical protein